MNSQSSLVVGIENLTTDYRLRFTNPNIASELETLFSASSPEVSFASSSEWDQLYSRLLPLAQHHDKCPGGNVGNVLSSFARNRCGASRVEWVGTCANDKDSRDGVRSLVSSGIFVRPIYHPYGTTRVLVLYLFEGMRHAKHRIVVCAGSWPKSPKQIVLPGKTGELIVGLNTILTSPEWVFKAIAEEGLRICLSLNYALTDSTHLNRIRELIGSRKISTICGHQLEVDAFLTALEMRPRDLVSLAQCDLVATQGRHGVMGFVRGSVNSVHQGIKSGVGEGVDTVGAGDAFLGGFFATRLNGDAFEDCLSNGQESAREVILKDESRLHLSSISFADELIANMQQELTQIRQFCEMGSGLCVISGGQTGIDQIGLECAALYGIASHAVLPRHHRTEVGALTQKQIRQIGNPRIHELSSPSYRSRTWATSYVADATLVINFFPSEGHQCNVDAANALGRPLVDTDGLRRSVDDVLDDLLHVGCRILNIAGHRGSQLTEERAMESRSYLCDLLRRLAYRLPPDPIHLCSILLNSTDLTSNLVSTDHLTIALPSAGLMHRYLTDQFQNLDVRKVYGRPRDFGRWLDAGVVDVICGGIDDLVEGGAQGDLVFDTGLFASSISLVGKNLGQGKMIVSQTPILAKGLLRREGLIQEVMPINGAAEQWIGLGLADISVDTLSTGKTLAAFDQKELKRMAATSLVVLTKPNLEKHKRVALGRVLSKLKE